MASTLVRGKYVICKITGSSSSEVITDGAVFQRDGEISEVGRYDDLRTRYTVDEIIEVIVKSSQTSQLLVG